MTHCEFGENFGCVIAGGALAIATGKPVWAWYTKALAAGGTPADPALARVAGLLGKHGRLLAKQRRTDLKGTEPGFLAYHRT